MAWGDFLLTEIQFRTFWCRGGSQISKVMYDVITFNDEYDYWSAGPPDVVPVHSGGPFMTREDRSTENVETPTNTPSGVSLSRRHAIGAGVGMAATTTFARVGAQSATPDASPTASPVASPVSTDETPDPNATFERISPDRDEVNAGLREEYGIEEIGNPGGDVIQVFTSDITMVNPLIAQDIASSNITGLIYETLVTVHPTDGTLIPGLADWWELGSDGLRHRFHIDDRATWHDGQPVTADDVIMTFSTALDESGFSPTRGTLDRAMASFEKIDDKTVEFVSRQKSATFINDTAAYLRVMPAHIWGDIPPAEWNGDEGTTGQDPARVIGSGPFTFTEWVTGQNVIVSKNENYWDSDRTPNIDRYIYNIVAESTSALQSLETGAADITGVSSALAPDFFSNNPNFNIHEYDRSHVAYYCLNLDEAHTTLFSDKRVRQAMLYALDRDLIVEEIYQGFAVRADGPQPPLSPAYAPEEIEHIYLYDPDTANALLDEAGWEMGDDGIRVKDGKPFEFEFTYEQDSATYGQLIPYMQEQWKAVGLQMEALAMPFAAQQEMYNTRTYDAGLTGITLNTVGNQGTLFRSDSMYPDGYNETAYVNPEYDRLDDLQRRELDPERRREILIELSNIVAEDLPISPTVFASGLTASSPRLHNYHPSGFSARWSIPYWWVEAE